MTTLQQHQQLLLQTMGIQTWIERHQPTHITHSTVWREEPYTAVANPTITPKAITNTIPQTQSNKTAHHREIDSTPVLRQLKSTLQQLNDEKAISSNTPEPLTPTLPAQSLNESSTLRSQINVHLWLSDVCIILVNLTEHVPPEQWQLWHKMKVAFQQLNQKYKKSDPIEYLVNWQYDFLPLQQPESAHAFMQGLIDYYTLANDEPNQARPIVCLGELPFLSNLPDSLQQLPSLEAMHQDQQQKKIVWQTVLNFYKNHHTH